jgi:hypothetical protein
MVWRRLAVTAVLMGSVMAGRETRAGDTLHLIHTSDVRGTVGICG